MTTSQPKSSSNISLSIYLGPAQDSSGRYPLTIVYLLNSNCLPSINSKGFLAHNILNVLVATHSTMKALKQAVTQYNLPLNWVQKHKPCIIINVNIFIAY